MKFHTAALQFLVASDALRFGVRAQSVVVDRTSDTIVADAAVSDVLLKTPADSGGRFSATGINNHHTVVDSGTRYDGSSSKTGSMYQTVADAGVLDVLLNSVTRGDGSSSKTGTMHHTVADAAVSDVLVEMLPADSTVADGWLLPTATFAEEGSSLRFPRKLAKISTKDVIRQAKKKSKEAKKTNLLNPPSSAPSSESAVPKPACVNDPGTILHNGVKKEACLHGRETDTMLLALPIPSVGMYPVPSIENGFAYPYEIFEGVAYTAEQLKLYTAGWANAAYSQLSKVAFSDAVVIDVSEDAAVASSEVVAAEAGTTLLAAAGGPLVWGLVVVIGVGTLLASVLGFLAGGGIIDKDAICYYKNTRDSCDGKIVFGAKSRWTEEGVGHVHLCEPECNGCNLECYAGTGREHVDAKWDPDLLAVEFVSSGGLNIAARNTIKYIAQNQFQKDYQSIIKATTPPKLVDNFTRHQLNMYVEQYLLGVCRLDSYLTWIPCAEENGRCFCPMGTVRYGHADKKKWANTKISNTVSFMPKGQLCAEHGKCPAHLPHKGPSTQDGSYMCYRDLQYHVNIQHFCPSGFTFVYETGQCTASWTDTCDESCWKGKCDDGKGYWNPSVYTGYEHHAYTCYMANMACHTSAHTGRPDVTECNCDPYYQDTAVSDFVENKNPNDKAIVSDTAFAFQVFQMAQAGGAQSLKGIGSEALVECTNNQFGDPAPHYLKTCQCKRTTCKDLATVRAKFRSDYESAVLNWNK